jgi:hypothetical protein
MNEEDKMKLGWKARGYNPFMTKPIDGTPKAPSFQAGANFDALLDELLFNRMIRLKNLSQRPQGHEPGKVYWDNQTKRAKIWIDETGKWADLVHTSTSTSTSSTSTSSTSTSSTSTSTT